MHYYINSHANAKTLNDVHRRERSAIIITRTVVVM